ncbi:MAG: dUTP diphosphatase [Alphaproteobacteria bacterium]|nr:dUTP diphosphatase [Alphaproteobacteria bacterium]
MTEVCIKILPHGQELELPQYATEGSAAMDLRAAVDEDVVIAPGKRFLVPSGVAIALPKGSFADIRPRSGLALKHGITVLNTPGTIDSDYRGELKVLLINFGEDDFVVTRGMRIAQLLVQRYERVEWQISQDLEETSRSGNGYGSTGTK